MLRYERLEYPPEGKRKRGGSCYLASKAVTTTLRRTVLDLANRVLAFTVERDQGTRSTGSLPFLFFLLLITEESVWFN